VPKVDSTSKISALRRFVAPSFPKAIALAAVLCGSILWKYRAPVQITAHASRVRPAVTKKVAAAPKIQREPKVQLSPVPLIGNPAVATPPNVVAEKKPAKKSRKKVVATSKAMKRFFAAAAKMEPDFDWPEVDESLLAVNLQSPAEAVAEEKLAEEFEDSGLSVNLVNLKPAAPEVVSVADNRLQVIIGEEIQNDFKDIKAKIAGQKAAFDELQTPAVPEPELVKPEPQLVRVEKAQAKVAKKKPAAPQKVAVVAAVAKIKPAPALIVPKESKEAAPAPQNEAALNAYFARMGSLGAIIDEASPKNFLTPSPSTPVTTQNSTPQISAATTQNVSAIPEQRVAKDDKNVLVIPTPGRAPIAEGQVRVVPPTEDRKAIDPQRTAIEERLQGRLELSDKVIDWVEMRDAFIELSLVRVGNLSSQGTLPVNYHFPEQEFNSDPINQKGEFWLQANFYPNNHAEALSLPIFYKEKISAATQNKFIHFSIDEVMLEKAIQGMQAAPSNGVWFTSIFYKVDPGKDKPNLSAKSQLENRVTQGEISFVGFPKWGSYRIEADGTSRAALPARSELLAKVTAPGYYPTYQIIPTFSSAINSYIYLTNEVELDPIIRYFTGQPQAKLDLLSPGMIFLRTFNPATFEPLGQVPIDISHANSANRLLPATSATGFGGFTNVVPSMRVINRGEEYPVWLTHVPEGSAQYVEYGRGGMRTLVGKVVSLGGEAIGPVRVRLAGDKNKKSETWSDDVGNFRIRSLDFPPGVVTLEIEVPGSAGFVWYNLSYDPAQPESTRKVFVSPSSRRLANENENLGVVEGALDTSFFRGNDCVYVHMIDTSGAPVSREHGPFPLNADRDEKNPYCVPRTADARSYLKFVNLRDGEYIYNVESASGKLLRTHVLRVGAKGRRTITVD